ncbi:MAG: SDR family oxidoreductase [Thermoplasmata archaeon]|nr:SDR family oxidoreductase [Thermoplasmata archaeon]
MRALVTGASQGIGRATALRLARDGSDVAVHYRAHAAEADAVVDQVRTMGRDSFPLRADLADLSSIDALTRQLQAHWDTLDVLVHNAGSYPRQSFSKTRDSDFEEQLRIHAVGPASLTRHLLPLLRRSVSGRIVFVSSVLAFEGSRRGSPYATAKAAQLGLARSLARELAPGITVNVVAPGAVDTAVLAADSAQQREERARQIPAGRIGTADEVAAAIAFLASPTATYITGATIPVNGGLRMG